MQHTIDAQYMIQYDNKIMKILIITPPSKEADDLVRAATTRGHHVIAASITTFSTNIGHDGSTWQLHNTALPQIDVCLFRGIYPHMNFASALAQYLEKQGVRVIDRTLTSPAYRFDKLVMSLLLHEHAIPIVPTYYFPTRRALTLAIPSLPNQLVVKHIQGKKSKNIYLTNKEEVTSLLSDKKTRDYFFQPYVEADVVYRVLVLGSTVLGATKRIAYFSPARKEKRLAERTTTAELTPEIKDLARRATEALQYDIAGVDLIETNGKWHVLEVNRAPLFKRFTSVTTIPVADHIITFLEEHINQPYVK